MASDRCQKNLGEPRRCLATVPVVRRSRAGIGDEPPLAAATRGRHLGRVEMWRGSSRFGLSVAAPFVWRCPRNLAITPFPHPPHRTGR
ncbi:MAG: hypothetical protein FJY56_02070, partial [Betaproteobacteria bacterium]|nr:hypothetical protein [Betaproteobacteria bacterium]